MVVQPTEELLGKLEKASPVFRGYEFLPIEYQLPDELVTDLLTIKKLINKLFKKLLFV